MAMQSLGPLRPDIDRDTALLAESIESVAWADFFAAAPPEVVDRYGTRVVRRGSARLLLTPRLPDTILNRTLGLGLDQPATEADVEAVIGAYKHAASARFAVAVSPLAGPDLLPIWLEARGLAHLVGETKLVRAADPPVAVPTDLQVGPVDVDQADAFARVAVDVFGLPAGVVPWISALVGRPSWYAYAAADGGELVAVGALFVQGNAGWLGFDATRASHRRRGAQSAIIARRIQEAALLGCRWLAAETGKDTEDSPSASYHNYRRTGFSVAYLRTNFEPRSH